MATYFYLINLTWNNVSKTKINVSNFIFSLFIQLVKSENGRFKRHFYSVTIKQCQMLWLTTMILPLNIVKSLRSTFVLVQRMNIAVKLPSTFALDGQFALPTFYIKPLKIFNIKLTSFELKPKHLATLSSFLGNHELSLNKIILSELQLSRNVK